MHTLRFHITRATVASVAGILTFCMVTSACSGTSSHANSPKPSTSVTTVAEQPTDSIFGNCPTTEPSMAAGSQTATTSKGLAGKLVPLAATSMQVCQYDAQNLLAASGVVTVPKTVAKLLEQTNGLNKGAPAPGCPPITAPRFFVTFAARVAGKVTKLDIGDVGNCGYVTNGAFVAIGKLNWRTALSRSGLTIAEDHVIPVPTGATPAPGTGRLTGSLNSDSRCFWLVDGGGKRTDVIWPAGYTGRAKPLRVLDPTGHVVASTGSPVGLGGGRVQVSAKVLAGVAPNLRLCLPPANCQGDTCGIWIAA